MRQQREVHTEDPLESSNTNDFWRLGSVGKKKREKTEKVTMWESKPNPVPKPWSESLSSIARLGWYSINNQ
jgi:hypothetical protein